MTEIENPIPGVLEAYRKAVLAKDVDAFVALYDRNVRVFDMWGAWSYDGLDAWRVMVSGWFGSLGTERVAVEFADVQSIATPALAVCHAFVTYKGLSGDGEALRAMQNRLTWTLEPRDGAWKIVHEHSSAPVDFDTAKVILKREAAR